MSDYAIRVVVVAVVGVSKLSKIEQDKRLIVRR